MREGHPSLETLARWLAGELEHEEVLQEVAPHLTENCLVCRRNEQEIRCLQKESGHWSETVAVFETRQAPELARLLEGHPYEEQMRLAEENEDLHTWGLCQYLLRKTREAVFEDPARAVETALVAIRLAGHLGDTYHPGWVLDLRARAYAYLGNGLRVLGELKAADHALLRAEENLRRSGTGNAQIEAEVLSLRASLKLDQRLFGQARELLDRSLALYRQSEDFVGVATAILQKVKLVKSEGDIDGSIRLLREGLAEIETARQPRLRAYALQSLLASLTLAGRNKEAADLLPSVQALFQESAEPLDWLRLRWTEASIVQGLGRTDEAEAAYREVQGKFLEMRKSYDAALVSLDLAALLAGQGRTEELKTLAAEILPVFESREVHREAMASLLLFQQACAEERATLELIQQIASALRRDRRGNGGS
ncbi:MAG: MalT-like region [Acidobacteriota bacterium]|nr:MalT-like region [Acidobacteriota bacterium]